MTTRGARLLTAAVVIGAPLIAAVLCAQPREEGVQQSAGAAAMRVYRDRATGKFTQLPPEADRALETATHHGTPHHLVLEPNPAGGVSVLFDEENQHELRITTDASGKQRVDCKRGGDAGQE